MVGLILTSWVLAQKNSELYPKTKATDFLTHTYGDYKQFPSYAFIKEELGIWAGVGFSTILTYYYDRGIYEGARHFGNSLGLDEHAQMKSIFCPVSNGCIWIPHDAATSLYFIGDGLTYLAMASSFLGYGVLQKDTKAVSVGSQILEGILDIGLATQVLKRLTGRETPIRASSPRGDWDLFPSVSTYQSDIPKYDAFPSGHVASTTVAFTILQANYPEYSHIIMPTYGVLMSLLMFEMVHLGVHWASDYPLGIAIGYYFGKAVSGRYTSRPINLSSRTDEYSSRIVPVVNPNFYGVNLEYKF